MNFVGVNCISNSFLHTHMEKPEYIFTKMLTLLYGHLWLVRV